ncbi:unnamed protein product [Caenorhabditis bovis]|uniref:Uncharacterized protein n=1 Tax=Caenorhabditis bovis TaxID=2654633 RepID=A0A8S1FF46_9PELO|nr:unnamed protein product [Caenorhabditis bovis]
MEMLSSLGDMLNTVQSELSTGVERLRQNVSTNIVSQQKISSESINEILNTQAGNQLLSQFQVMIKEIVENGDEGARLANLCSTRMGRTQQLAKERAEAVMEIDSFMRNSSDFDRRIREINSQLIKLQRFCNQTEQAMTYLEALCEVARTEDEVDLIRQQARSAATIVQIESETPSILTSIGQRKEDDDKQHQEECFSSVRRFSTADGIGSPTDHAYAPPGVLTKLNSIIKIKPTILIPKKMFCACCNKKTSCNCKKCTLECLAFYSRKERLFLRNSEKKRYQNEIEKLQADMASNCAEIASRYERVSALRSQVENAKMRIEIKRGESVSLKEQLSKKDFKQFEIIFKSQEKKLEELNDYKMKYEKELDRKETMLAKTRHLLCLTACRIFPIQEIEVDVEDIEKPMESSKNWALVNTTEAGRRYKIRGGYINDSLKNRLTTAIAGGTITLPPEMKPPFAAFVHTVQLVHLLNVIFNFRPPHQISHRELCIRERWSSDCFTNEWQNLCDSVIYLCAYLGMKAANLKYSIPHANILEFGSFVLETGDIKNLGNRPRCDMSTLQELFSTERVYPTDREETEEINGFLLVDL